MELVFGKIKLLFELILSILVKKLVKRIGEMKDYAHLCFAGVSHSHPSYSHLN